MGYTLKEELGSNNPLSRKKRMGYALYHNGEPVYPRFRNWWPTKVEAEKALSEAKKEEKDTKKRATRKKRQVSSKRSTKKKDDYWERVSKLI